MRAEERKGMERVERRRREGRGEKVGKVGSS